jgi:hypothetical protein
MEPAPPVTRTVRPRGRACGAVQVELDRVAPQEVLDLHVAQLAQPRAPVQQLAQRGDDLEVDPGAESRRPRCAHLARARPRGWRSPAARCAPAAIRRDLRRGPSTGTPCIRIPACRVVVDQRHRDSSRLAVALALAQQPLRRVPAPMIRVRRPAAAARQGRRLLAEGAHREAQAPEEDERATQSSTRMERGKPVGAGVAGQEEEAGPARAERDAFTRSTRSRIPTCRHQPWNRPNTPKAASRSTTT